MTEFRKMADGSQQIEEHLGGQTVRMPSEGKILLRAQDPGVRHPERLRLLNDYVAVRPDGEVAVTDGGIIIPEQAKQEQYDQNDFVDHSEQWHTGVVMAMGPGDWHRTRSGKIRARRVPIDVELGDRIWYHRSSALGLVWTDGVPVALFHAAFTDSKMKLVSAIGGIVVEDDAPAPPPMSRLDTHLARKRNRGD